MTKPESIELTKDQIDLFSSISKVENKTKEIKVINVDTQQVKPENNELKEVEITYSWLQNKTNKTNKKRNKIDYNNTNPKDWNSNHVIKYIRDICRIKYSIVLSGSIASDRAFAKSIITFFKDFDYIKTPKDYIDWYFANKSDELFKAKKQIWIKDFLDYFCMRDYSSIMFNNTNKKKSYDKILSIFKSSYDSGGDTCLLSDFGPLNYYLYVTKNKIKSEKDCIDVIKKFYSNSSNDDIVYHRSIYSSINNRMFYTEVFSPAEVKLAIDKLALSMGIEKWMISFKLT